MNKCLKRSEVFILFCSERIANEDEAHGVDGEWQSAYQTSKRRNLRIITVTEDLKYVPELLLEIRIVSKISDKY